jgi:D-3-phosphoglycerate dehydrogenase
MGFFVAVTDDRFGSYEEEKSVFKDADIRLEVLNLNKESLLPDTLLDADAILCNLFPIHKGVIERLRACRIISRYGVGYDNVDCEAAAKKGIWVTNVPDYSIEDVTDHVIAFLLASARRIVPVHRRIVDGEWNLNKAYGMRRIRGKALGIVGFGRIGQALRRKVAGFGFSRVLVFDPYVDEAFVKQNGAESVDFAYLLEHSDFVSLHVPLTKETTHLVSAQELERMKDTSVLINTSRGKVVDEAALYAALSARPQMTAGLDVFEEEPLPSKSLLRTLDNIVMSSHLAYYTEESLAELKTKAARNVLEVLLGNPPLYPVNNINTI